MKTVHYINMSRIPNDLKVVAYDPLLSIASIRLCFILRYHFSWLSLTDNRFVLAVRNASEWYLGPFRGLIVVGSVDLSVLLAMIIYEGITGLLIGIPLSRKKKLR